MSEDAFAPARFDWRTFSDGLELQQACISGKMHDNYYVTSAVKFFLSPVSAKVLARGKRKMLMECRQVTLPKIAGEQVPEYMCSDNSDFRTKNHHRAAY